MKVTDSGPAAAAAREAAEAARRAAIEAARKAAAEAAKAGARAAALRATPPDGQVLPAARPSLYDPPVATVTTRSAPPAGGGVDFASYRSALPPVAQAVLDAYAAQMGPDAAAARFLSEREAIQGDVLQALGPSPDLTEFYRRMASDPLFSAVGTTAYLQSRGFDDAAIVDGFQRALVEPARAEFLGYRDEVASRLYTAITGLEPGEGYDLGAVLRQAGRGLNVITHEIFGGEDVTGRAISDIQAQLALMDGYLGVLEGLPEGPTDATDVQAMIGAYYGYQAQAQASSAAIDGTIVRANGQAVGYAFGALGVGVTGGAALAAFAPAAVVVTGATVAKAALVTAGASLLSACGGPTPPPPGPTSTGPTPTGPTPTEPAFVPFTDAFEPLAKAAYVDAAGVQHRPIEVVIDRATYDDLAALGMDPSDFVNRHVQRMNQILANSGVKIVIDAPNIRYVESMTSDQRGPWNVANSGNWPLTGGFDPTKLGYWNATEQMDYGLLHEWGHSVLGLWDDYGFDVHALDAAHPFDAGTTRVYGGPDGLMGAGSTKSETISAWQAMLLNRWVAEGVGLDPHRSVGITSDDVPRETVLQLDPALAGREVFVYQSFNDNGTKRMNPQAAFNGAVGPDGTYAFDSRALFGEILGAASAGDQSNLARTSSGTVLVGVNTDAGTQYYWLDLSDFVMARTTSERPTIRLGP